MKRTLPVLAALLIVLCWSETSPAQTAAAANAGTAAQITKARTANAALMKQYSWNSRVEVLDQGVVKDLRIELVNYGPMGQLQRNILNDQSAPLPFGFLRRKIAEDERAKVEEYLMGLRSLLEQYTLPSEGKILTFMNQATTSGPDANGLFEMTGQNVVYPGDAFSVWTDLRARPKRMQVTTIFQGDQVDLTATFKTLKSGLTYMAWGEVIVPAKQMSVTVQNFDYNRGN
jgi:hypothetical protein